MPLQHVDGAAQVLIAQRSHRLVSHCSSRSAHLPPTFRNWECIAPQYQVCVCNTDLFTAVRNATIGRAVLMAASILLSRWNSQGVNFFLAGGFCEGNWN